jgi:hypothetical protein
MTTFEILDSTTGEVVGTAVSSPLAEAAANYLHNTTLRAHHIRAVAANTRTPRTDEPFDWASHVGKYLDRDASIPTRDIHKVLADDYNRAKRT